MKPGRTSGKRRTRERIAADRAALQAAHPADFDAAGPVDPRAVAAEVFVAQNAERPRE